MIKRILFSAVFVFSVGHSTFAMESNFGGSRLESQELNSLEAWDASSDGSAEVCEESSVYDPGALATCKRHLSARYYQDCLDIIRNQVYEAGVLEQCNRHVNAAPLNDCLYYSASRKFQPIALQACSRHLEAVPFNRCIRIIRDRVYTADQIDACNGFRDAQALNTCLSR